MGYKSKYSQSHNTLGDITLSGSLSAGAWEAGYLGNSEFISVQPADFNLQVGPMEPGTPGFVQGGFPPFGSGRAIELMYTNGTGGSILVPTARMLHAQKIIPKGFKATAAIVYGNPSSFWTAEICNVEDASRSTAVFPTDVNDQASFLSDVIGDGINYISIGFDPEDNSSECYGAQIFIEKI